MKGVFTCQDCWTQLPSADHKRHHCKEMMLREMRQMRDELLSAQDLIKECLKRIEENLEKQELGDE